MSQMRLTSSDISANAPTTKTSTRPPFPPRLDLNSSKSGYARLGSGEAPPLGVVKEEVGVLIAIVHRHRRAVGAAVRRAVDDEVPGAVEEESRVFGLDYLSSSRALTRVTSYLVFSIS